MVAKILPKENSEEVGTSLIIVHLGIKIRHIGNLKGKGKAAELSCLL